MSSIYFLKFNPDDSLHVEELNRQRLLCGWGLDSVELWRDQSRRDEKGLYWIIDPSADLINMKEPEFLSMKPDIQGPPANPSFKPLPSGHISLDWMDYKGDDSLANREEKKITVATFFVLASQQGKGLGSISMDLVEAKAKELGAVTITLNTLPRESAMDQGFWESFGWAYDPKARINEDWYRRRGYVVYKHQLRHEETLKNGEKTIMRGVFMSKAVI